MENKLIFYQTHTTGTVISKVQLGRKMGGWEDGVFIFGAAEGYQ